MSVKSVNDLSVSASKNVVKRNNKHPYRTIGWYCQMTRDETLSQNKIAEILSELEKFIDQKYYEKSEIIAELQLAEAYQEIFEENLLDLRQCS